MEIATIGLDLAKNAFQVNAVTGITAGVFTPSDDIFADEPSMSGGFRPETLLPVAALTLLGMVRRYARRA